jgi:excisionase family DNA binding protein
MSRTMTKPRQQIGDARTDDQRFGELLSRRLLRTRHAAAYLGISEWKLRALIQDGQIPVVQYGEYTPWLIDLRDLDLWIADKKQIIPL